MKGLSLFLLLVTLISHAEAKKSFTQIREERVKFFAENPKEAIGDYDDLELDLLYQDLDNLSILDLSRKYPELSPKELEELKTKRK